MHLVSFQTQGHVVDHQAHGVRESPEVWSCGDQGTRLGDEAASFAGDDGSGG